MSGGWETVELDTVLKSTLIGLVRNKKEQSQEFDYVYIKMNNITNDNCFSPTELVRVNADLEDIEKFQLADGDMLFNTRNSHELVGKSCIYQTCDDRPVLFNNNIMRLRFQQVIIPEFAAYSFCSESVKKQLLGMVSGTTNVAGIYFKNLRHLKIPLPRLPEQKRIVAILDEAFGAIARAKENAERNLANARELFDSYLQSVFGSHASGELVEIGAMGEVFDGPHATPKTVETGPVFLGIKNLDRGSLDLSKTRHVTEQDFAKWTRRVVPRAGDVVFSYETKLGAAATIPEDFECCLGRRMGLVRLDSKKVDSQFFLYQYISPPFQKYLSEFFIKGATVDRISIKNFPTYAMRLPQISEQLEAVNKIRCADSEVRKLEKIYEQKLNSIDELKQSLLQKAFTGQLTSQSKELELVP